jgi:pyridoxal 5'-phosphate synthase pdxT subunit
MHPIDSWRQEAAEKYLRLNNRMGDASYSFSHTPYAMNVTVGVLALQGAFEEHLTLLRKASESISSRAPEAKLKITFSFREVRTAQQLALCDSLIIPGGESTTISIVAARSNLLEPLRDFVK